MIDTKVNKSLDGGFEQIGHGSMFTSSVYGGTDDHLTLDLRNTTDDQNFVVRYSADNDGVARNIGILMKHYGGEAHVGVGTSPDQGKHLHVKGNTLVTGEMLISGDTRIGGNTHIDGNIVVAGDSSSFQTSNLVIEDPHILLNRDTSGPDSTTSNLLSAGIWFAGDDNDVVGYVRVHDTDLSQLVAKAPTGGQLVINIDGDSAYNSDAGVITIDSSDWFIQNTPGSFKDSTISMEDSNTSVTRFTMATIDSTLNIDNSTVNIDANLTVESASWVDQDLTVDSSDTQFAGLTVTNRLEIPTHTTATSTTQDNSLPDGQIRFCTNSNIFQGSKDGWWVPFEQYLSDKDGDTHVEVRDDNSIHFTVSDEEILAVDSTGLRVVQGQRKLKPALKYTCEFDSSDMPAIAANLTVRGIGADASEPIAASAVEMIAADIIPGNNYVVIDHMTDSIDTMV